MFVTQDNRYKVAVDKLADLLAMERHWPLDNAVWLLEHVSRTKGAEHLKMASRNLNLVQYFCIDVIVSLVVLCAVIGISLCKFFSQLLPWIYQNKYDIPIKLPFLMVLAIAAHHVNKHVPQFSISGYQATIIDSIQIWFNFLSFLCLGGIILTCECAGLTLNLLGCLYDFPLFASI